MKSVLNLHFRGLDTWPLCSEMKERSRNFRIISSNVKKQKQIDKDTKTIEAGITWVSFVSALLLSSVCLFLIRVSVCIRSWPGTTLVYYADGSIQGKCYVGEKQRLSLSPNCVPPVGKCPLCWSVIEQVTGSLLAAGPCSCSCTLTLTSVGRDSCLHNMFDHEALDTFLHDI